jgi:2,3-bisphosphoglycerate-dependent phosphoglycerate mutase
MRHAVTYYNDDEKFAGILDIPLSSNGISETVDLGKRYEGIPVDFVFVSTLSRSLETALIFLSNAYHGKTPIVCHRRRISDKVSREFLPIVRCAALNERHYGKLQNLSKKTVNEKYGEEQVFLWRRDILSAPPFGESFESIVERVRVFFENDLLPKLDRGADILVVAHQNTLRALWYLIFNVTKIDMRHIEFSNNEIVQLQYKSNAFYKV